MCSSDLETTERRLRAARMGSADAVRRRARPLVSYSPGRRSSNLELRKYLYRNLYYNPAVRRPNTRAVQMLEALFHHYLEHPHHLGEQSRRRIRTEGLHRAVCDYLAGMTDRYAIEEHARLIRKE